MAPYSKDPPEKTASCALLAASVSVYDRWVKVCPGVAIAVTRIRAPISTTSPSRIGVRSKDTLSLALTRYAAPVRRANASPR